MVMSNPTRWLKPACLSALMSVGVLLGASRASAETCGDNDACAHGFVCHSFESVSCATDCPEGAKDCVERECKPSLIKQCVPAQCEADADCAEGMVCFTETYEQCSGGRATPPCEPDAGDCKPVMPEPAPDACTTVKRSSCVPRYVPPCREDKDCGTGFHCKELQETSCSSGGSWGTGGSSGAGSDPREGRIDAGVGSSEPAAPADGDGFAAVDGGAPREPDAKPAPDTTCTTKPTGRFYCELEMVSCKQNSDCPSGFTCHGYGKSDVACTGPAPAPAPAPQPSPVLDAGTAMTDSAGDAGTADVAPDGGHSADGGPGDAFAPVPPPRHPTCEPVQVQMFCVPPFADIGFGVSPTRDAQTAHSGSANGSAAPSTADGGNYKSGDAPMGPAEEAGAPKPVLNCSAGTLGATRSSTFGLIALVGVAMYFQRRRARS